MIPPAPLLKKKDVAAILRVSSKTVDHYCEPSRVPRLRFVRIPAGRRFKAEDVEKFINAVTV